MSVRFADLERVAGRVTVTVTDDDDGVGVDDATVNVGNIDPTVDLDTSDAVSFPGGDYVVTDSEGMLDWSADASDVGSDDITFTWSTGDATTYFNDGVAPDPLPSPLATFPFDASDAIVAAYSEPGVDTLGLTVADGDGGIADAEAGVVITGVADTTRGSGWWKHQLSGNGSPHVDDATLAGYLEAVEAVSGIFSEVSPAGTFEEAHAVLSTGGGNARDRVTAELLLAWLHFASGAVSFDATVPLGGGASIDYLDLMFAAEDTIANPASTNKELNGIRQDLARVRHTG